MLQKLAVMALVLATPLALSAQGPGGSGVPGGPGGPGFGGLRGPMMGFRGFGPGGFGERVVTNQPYSDVESSADTMNARDGKTVTHQNQEQKWRDAAGRTRIEVTEPAVGKRPAIHRAEIFDPVKHTMTSLDFAKKVAIVRQLPQPHEGQGPHGPRPENGEWQPHTLPGVTVTTTDLPAKQIAGVYATGKQTVRTVAAGIRHNAEPIVNTSDVYVSPDLKIVLYSSDTDPRGSRLHQVTTLNRADPDESLFDVPADFTVRTPPQRAGRGGGPHGPGGPPPAAE